MTDLAALLADPAAVPAGDIPAALGELERVKAVLWARLTVPPASTPAADEWLTDVAVVAQIARRSVSWVRKNGHTLPGFSQPRGKGTKVAWSRRALEAWAASPTA